MKAWVLMVVLASDQTYMPRPMWYLNEDTCRAGLQFAAEAMAAEQMAVRLAWCQEVWVPRLNAIGVEGIVR